MRRFRKIYRRKKRKLREYQEALTIMEKKSFRNSKTIKKHKNREICTDKNQERHLR